MLLQQEIQGNSRVHHGRREIAGKFVWVLLRGLGSDRVSEPGRLRISRMEVLVEARVSLREQVVDERLVRQHLLLEELGQRVNWKLAHVSDLLSELRGEAVDEPRHR